jgi:hypothetical protein
MAIPERNLQRVPERSRLDKFDNFSLSESQIKQSAAKSATSGDFEYPAALPRF